MGSIRERVTSKGEVTYQVRIRRLGYPSKSATFKSIGEAKRWLRLQEITAQRQLHLEHVKAASFTLNDAIERFFDEEEVVPLRAMQIKRWKEILGHLNLTAINSIAIHEGLLKLKKERNLTSATLNRHIDAISVVLNKAAEVGWITHNPAADIKRFREPRGRVRYLTDEEREKLLEACKKSDYPYLYFIVVLGLSTGMRKEELLALHWSDVDPQNGIILLEKTKNKERRRVSVRGPARQMLLEHYEKRTLDSPFLFPGVKPSPHKECKSVPASERHFDIRKPWQTARKRAGIKNFVFHDLRHSCASYLAMSGATALEIAEVLGHKSLDMVKRYSHLAESHTAKVVESMNQKLFAHLQERQEDKDKPH